MRFLNKLRLRLRSVFHRRTPVSDRPVVLFATTPARGLFRDTTSFPDFLETARATLSLTWPHGAQINDVPHTVVGVWNRLLGL